MTDRQSVYPGRVKLTNVETGESTIFDMELADEPTETGTPLNKANLLASDTEQTFENRFGAAPETPSEALDILAGAITAGTTDLTAGVSPLATGKLYVVYE